MSYYTIVKDFNTEGSVAISTDCEKMYNEIYSIAKKSKKDLEVVLLSKPSAFMEYAPYEFVDTIERLKERILERF